MNINANIRKLYLIKMAKWFMLTMPILMLYYEDNGFSEGESFMLKAAYSAAIVLFEVPSGYLADVMGRKRTLILGSILGTLGFAIYAGFSGFYAFLLAEITLGIGQSFISGSDSALLYDTLAYNQRTDDYIKYEARQYSIGNISEAVAGLIGGAIATYSLRLPFILQTCIAFLAVPAALTLFEPPQEKRRENPGMRDILHIMKYALITNRKLRYNMLISCILGTATLTLAWTYQLYLKVNLGFEIYAIGITHFCLNILVGITVLFAHQVERKLTPRGTIWLVSITITSVYIAMGFIQNSWMLIALALFYMARGIATPVLRYYVNRITTSDIRATVLSTRSLIIRMLFAILAPCYGLISDHFGRAIAMRILGITFTVLVGLTIHLFLNSLDEEIE